MCRLFALHAGPHDVAAEFWLLEAPDSFAAQSEVNADGFGLAALTVGEALLLIRNPVRALDDATYGLVARRAKASQFMAHLRYASTGRVSLQNTHPFVQDNRVFAHNGVIGDLEKIERRIGDGMAMVAGDTDSERLFALVTICIREAGGDVRVGIRAAVRELAEQYELYSINFVLGQAGHFWAFRYPEHNPLMIQQLQPSADPVTQDGQSGTMHLHFDEPVEHPVVIIASEPMDSGPGWEPIHSGELVHIGPDLAVDRELILTEPPRYPMVLGGVAEISQRYERADAPA